ncbi:retrovirus-related Pol polyprotein from transposon opus [Trichonephila clavata]|uniref:Retrovirus-related Pol polyprotein from transposon opus n=1 Tax=Trichonephila clavata TaxID=2740835 RepID=A0A8X6GVK1_TRICU|nr:retrovirus-related Pol polyprotein from transposon opus [Trichonephila clavata]
MSFGLRNAPSTFQSRSINEVLFGLEFVFPYLDDILIAYDSEEQHKTHLKLVSDRLQKYGLRVNISKSTLGVTQLEFLGYLITPEGSKPLPEKVDVILSYKLPETIRELRTFLELINFYRRYLKDAAKNQAILHEYLKGSKKNDKTKILWTEEAKENFEKCKQDLAHATLLSFPDPDLQLIYFYLLALHHGCYSNFELVFHFRYGLEGHRGPHGGNGVESHMYPRQRTHGLGGYPSDKSLHNVQGKRTCRV